MEHNCVRNPASGNCYVCNTPMRQNFGVMSALDAAIDATQHPKAPAPPPAPRCPCGAIVKPSEALCVDCWIAEQTKQPAPKPKPVKQTKPASGSLNSILESMMENNPNKWN